MSRTPSSDIKLSIKVVNNQLRMFQTKMKQHTQQIINHIKEGKYQLKKIKEEKRDSFR